MALFPGCVVKLCGEPNAKNTAASAMHITVGKASSNKWAQMGYRRARLIDGSAAIQVETYAETHGGCGNSTCYNIEVRPFVIVAYTEYELFMTDLACGCFNYRRAGFAFHSWIDPLWANDLPTQVIYSTEIFNPEDQMVGTESSTCNFKDCRYQHDFQFWPLVNFTPSDVTTDDVNEWGIGIIDSNTLKIWDKKP